MPRHEAKELSMKNQYYISRDHYLELYYFCKQYNSWKKEYENLIAVKGVNFDERINDSNVSDPTSILAERRLELFHKMELVEQTLIEASPDLAEFIFMNVTDDASYKYLSSRYIVPCSEKTFYKYRRRFFWLLAKKR